MEELLEWMEYMEDVRQAKKVRHKLKDIPVSYTHLDVYKRQVRSRIEAVSVPVKMPEVDVRKRYAEKHTQDFLRSVFSANAEETERIF